MGATWGKSARRGDMGANKVLIAVYQWNYYSAHRFSIWLNNFFKLSIRESTFQEWPLLTFTTKSNLQSLMVCLRKVSRINLLTRFRSTALGSNFLLAITPSRALFLQLRVKKILKCLSVTFSARMTWSKPSTRNNLYAEVNFADILHRESCTAPGSTRPDNCATPACFHAYQKAMGTFSFDNGWLVGTFHVFFLGKS